MSCPCCVSNYNKGTKAEIKCYFDDCNFSSCKECIRTYLTGTVNEPHCMHCRKKWNPEFTKASLNASFMQKEYRDHRKNILVDRTISQIQEYYPGAIVISQRRKDNVEIGKIQSEIDLLHQQINEKHNQISGIRHKTNAAADASAGERRKFVMPCQTDGCRGMLSTAYKCELCEKFTCAKCLESIDGDKDAHECVPANVETAEEIRKNTRPCPNCGCRISKIDGCFAENTPILLWNGEIKMSQDVCIGDELVGDDGNKRIVEDVCSGEDDLYEVQQNNGNTYVVNSKHTLVLQECGKNEIIHKTIDEYIKLTNTMKNKLYGLKSRNGINYENSTPNKDYFKTSISVKKVGFGNYYGWNINDNHRFVLSDFTVVKNCDQMWCIECKTAFSWSKGTVEVGIVHNPHYFQWMRQNGGMPGVPGGGCNENRLNTQLSFIRDFFSMLEKSVTYENDFMENCKKCGYTMDELKNIMPLVYANHNVIKKTKECEELERAKRVFSSSFFVNFHRFIIHTEHVTLRDLNDKIRFRNNENYPIHMYILGEQSREELSDFLVKRDIANARDISQRDIVEACVMVGKQILTDLHTELSSMEIDFSWRLIYDQLVAMRFSRTNTSLDYVKDKMVEFSKFYTVFLKPHKESIENLYRLCSVITNKYMRAINQYSAYSNAEMVKHLILHNSKKQLYMWDSDVENAHIFKYDCKESLTSGIEYFRYELEKYEEAHRRS